MKKDKKIIPLILDGDPGHDDAIAWVLARANMIAHGLAKSPYGGEQTDAPDSEICLDIRAVTAVGGNTTLDKTAYNALRVCRLIGLDCPVAAGAAGPLTGKLMNAPSVHGESGLDGPALPEPDRELSSLRAPELMAKVIAESEEPVTIVSTGPMTNTAILLSAYPEVKEKIARISFMGGGITHGNWTPAAEFNILVDPEAAKIVFHSGVPLLMSGLDVTEKALIKPEDFERIKALGNPVSDIVWQWLAFFYEFHRKLGYAGAPMHDPCAVMALIHPEVFTIRSMFVDVETGGEYTRGATLGDMNGILGYAPNVEVVLDLDPEQFAAYLIQAVARY